MTIDRSEHSAVRDRRCGHPRVHRTLNPVGYGDGARGRPCRSERRHLLSSAQDTCGTPKEDSPELWMPSSRGGCSRRRPWPPILTAAQEPSTRSSTRRCCRWAGPCTRLSGRFWWIYAETEIDERRRREGLRTRLDIGIDGLGVCIITEVLRDLMPEKGYLDAE
jgi:hypothetical protein